MLKYLWQSMKQIETECVPAGAIRFSYSQNSTAQALLLGFVLAALVEAVLLHVLLSYVSGWLAFAATVSTVVFILQVAAHIRAVGLRPIVVHRGVLFLRNGAFDIAEIPIQQIRHVELSSQATADSNDEFKPLNVGFPVSHNMIVKLKAPVEARILNLSSREFDVALMAIDNSQELKDLLDSQAGPAGDSNPVSAT
ncbi:MAG: hypothetical protein AAGG44_21335 [Planctomycetota bacterium]